MTKPIAVAAILAATVAAAGCSTIQRSIGATKVTPDESRVFSRASLAMPPDYNLRPPRPGEPRPQEQDPTAQARTALFGQDVGTHASAGERALVASAGATAADAGIRETIDYESQGVVRRSEGFVNRLLAFRGADEEAAAPLDAEAEARRLEELESIRRTTGDGAVTIRRESGGFKLPGT